MTGTPGWKVVGFVSASATEPAFVLPVLRRDGGNALVVQRIDEHGRISEFEPLDEAAADTVTHVHSPFQRHIGDPPLWAFRLTPNDHLVAEQPELRAYLAERLDTPELRAAPLVRLRVIQFIGRDDLLTDALRDAYALMQTLPDGTARFWRDNVVLAQRCRDILRERGIPEDAIDTEVHEGVLWVHPLDEIADGVDWAQALKLYVDAFGLALMVGAEKTKAPHSEEPLVAITAFLPRSWRVLNTLDRRISLSLVQVVSIDALRQGRYERIYVFMDGTESLPPKHLERLRNIVAPTPIHLIWADFGQQFPTRQHQEAVAGVTLFPVRTQWAGDRILENPERFSTTDLLELFLHIAASNGYQHQKRGVFVAALPAGMRSPASIIEHLWVSAVTPLLFPWDADLIIHTGDRGSPRYLQSAPMTMRRDDSVLPISKRSAVIQLYESAKLSDQNAAAAHGFACVFEMLGWTVPIFEGETTFQIKSPATGPVLVSLIDWSISTRTVTEVARRLEHLGDDRHIVIPITHRPTAEAMRRMHMCGFDVILPHRLPLLATPQSEWAITYAFLSQFNGKQLRFLLSHKLLAPIRNHLDHSTEREIGKVEIWSLHVEKLTGAEAMLVDVIVSVASGMYALSVHLSPNGPIIELNHFTPST